MRMCVHACLRTYVFEWKCCEEAGGAKASEAHSLPFRAPHHSPHAHELLSIWEHSKDLLGRFTKQTKLLENMWAVTFFTVEPRIVISPSFLTPSPTQRSRRLKHYIFKYFWPSPLATYVSNIPSWLPHVQALASFPFYCRMLCCFKGMAGPCSSHFSSIFAHTSQKQPNLKKEKLIPKEGPQLKYLFPLTLFF